jgi:competence transcription factor ComK
MKYANEANITIRHILPALIVDVLRGCSLYSLSLVLLFKKNKTNGIIGIKMKPKLILAS